MSVPIEDYAVLSDCRTAALVSREGSIDWFCAPRFDSASVFGAILGGNEQGAWHLRPEDADAVASRRYDGDTFVLVTRWESAGGIAEVHDFLPIDGGRVDIVRRIVGISGTVEFTTHLRIRFDYARAIPWVRQVGDAAAPALHAIAGPDALIVRGVVLTPHGRAHRGRVSVTAGETADLVATWNPSYLPTPEALDVDAALEHTRTWWTGFAASIDHDGPHRDEVVRSLLVLRALSHQDTGGIVAAVTTSLPEQIGGERNWDYRYVWLRDAALTLEALVAHGFLQVAEQWRSWLIRAIAGDPRQMQIMYGVAGERDLPERQLTSLPGYEGSAPVRVGNGAVTQYQADVVGEVMVSLEAARVAGVPDDPLAWALQRALLDGVEARIDEPDNGIWEVRGDPQRFTQSRAMMWAAFDRGVRAVRRYGQDGPVAKWEALRDRLREEIDTHGVDPASGAFVQHYGSTEVDASLLLLPQVGFCEPDDARMVATVARIEAELMPDGLVNRYRTQTGVDGLAGGEHPFIACTFWLVEQYARVGRVDDAQALMNRACATANDLGLFSEEYDPAARRQIGNTPQALSHLAQVRAADAMGGHGGRAAHRT